MAKQINNSKKERRERIECKKKKHLKAQLVRVIKL